MVICEMRSRTYLIPCNMSIGRIGRRAERKLLLPSWAPSEVQSQQPIGSRSTSATLARSSTMAGDHELLSSALQGTTLTVMARIGFGARGLVYLLVAAFATAAALGFGQQPHGIVDAVQAVANTQLQIILAGGIGAGLACLAAYFANQRRLALLPRTGLQALVVRCRPDRRRSDLRCRHDRDLEPRFWVAS